MAWEVKRDGYVARWHEGGRHGPWIGVVGPGIEGEAEWSAPQGLTGIDALNRAIDFAKERFGQ